MDFNLSPEHLLIRKMMAEFTENEVKPIAAETDAKTLYPRENIEKLFDLGVMGMCIPKEYGGQGADPLASAICIEELSKQCASTGDIVATHNGLCCDPILTHGTEEQKRKYLPDLLSGKKIGAIAEEMGFSAVRYYIKHFEQWFGMHPLEYRKRYMGKSMTRESRAKYKRCTPMEIETAIHALTRGAFAETEDKLVLKPVILDIGTAVGDDDNGQPKTAETSAKDPKEAGIFTIMERSVNDILAEPYHLLMDLGETVLAAGENYVITAEGTDTKDISRFSILVYNYDENVGRSLRKIHTENDLLRLVRHYDDEIEFLIRCNGFSGLYRIYRYRMDRENLAKKLTDSLNPEGGAGKRDMLIGRLTGAPTVTTNTYTSSDVLSVRTTFQGMGVELILVDRI